MTEQQNWTARQLMERFLAATIDPVGLDLAGLYANPATIEMPFAPPGLPRVTEVTPDQLRARLAAGQRERQYLKVEPVVIRETDDPEVVVTEFTLHGRKLAGDEPFTQDFILVTTVRDGRIVHTRDYTDPIAGSRMLGRLSELVEHLTA